MLYAAPPPPPPSPPAGDVGANPDDALYVDSVSELDVNGAPDVDDVGVNSGVAAATGAAVGSNSIDGVVIAVATFGAIVIGPAVTVGTPPGAIMYVDGTCAVGACVN